MTTTHTVLRQRRAAGGAGSKATRNVWLNSALLVLGVGTLISPEISIQLHIWLGSLTLLAVAAHLFLHRQWIQAIAQRFTQRLTLAVRAKAILDIIMLVVFVLVNVTGFVVALIYAPAIAGLHEAFALLFGLLVMGHLALNGKWIIQQARRIRNKLLARRDQIST